MTVTIIAAAMLISRWGAAATATGPSATPPSLSFSYQIPIPGITTTLPAAATLKIALPSTASSSTIISSATCQTLPCPLSWLTITPGSALASQTFTVNVNPTNLPPGSYPGTIYFTTFPDVGSLTVPVTFSVSNPPSSLVVSPGSATANFTAANGTTPDTLSFVYTTGSVWPAVHSAGIESELDVATTGDPITFNVTVAGSSGTGGKTIFLRVAPPGQAPGLQTNTLTVSGSAVPILVSIDQTVVQSLLPGGYSNTVTFAATSKTNGSHTVAISLQVTAGPPGITAIYPTNVVQAPIVNPIITITGVNFFTSSVVTMALAGAPSSAQCTQNPTTTNPTLTLTAVLAPQSQTLMQATVVNAKTNLVNTGATPIPWCICVLNGGALNSPQTPACAPAGTAPLDYTFNVISSSSMAITSVVNAASYSPAAKQIGRDINPVPTGNTAVAPGELISIFGRNLGPAGPLAATGSTAAVVISTAALAAKPNTSALATTLQFSVANPLGTTAVIVDFTNDPKAIAGGEALADIVEYINQQTTGTLGNVASLSNGGSYISLTSPTTGSGTAITVKDNTAAQLLKFTATTGDVTVAGADGEYPTQLDGIQVAFVYAGTTYYAPITMVYINQINALVPFELAAAPAGNAATVKVLNGAAATSAFGLIIVDEEPGIFTLAGSGTGQGAVVNVDSATGVWTLNSSSNTAARGSGIVIYATGLGSLATPLADAAAATGPDKLSDSVQVMIGGQPAVVTYAGTAAGYIGGIVQINAMVPPTVTAGKAVSLYIAGGDANTARESQGGVTLAVK